MNKKLIPTSLILLCGPPTLAAVELPAIIGNNSVTLSGDNSAGLPALPNRTDDWPLRPGG